jgi:hypothetical protein
MTASALEVETKVASTAKTENKANSEVLESSKL